MKLRFFKTPLITISLLSGSVFAQAVSEEIYVDFGSVASYTTNGTYYNVLSRSFATSQGGGTVGSTLSLQTSTNTTSGIELKITTLFGDANTVGTTTPSTPVSAFNISSLSSTAMYVFGGTTASFTLSGLTSDYTYKFTVFGSRSPVGDIRSADYTFTGATSETLVLNASNNTSNVVSTGALAADANGKIAFTIAKDTTNNNGSGYAYINGLQIEAIAVPEPATWAMILGGVGMLAFGQRLRFRAIK